MRLIGLYNSKASNRMITERLNSKYLKVSLTKPHLCVKNFDKTSHVFYNVNSDTL